ncbi:MAG: pseudouridylate synthase [Psychrilyobacter sp.]|uniref:pseudouridylate synthase n=1 Tax=Psychrilyobacter sp. TaxID=2586924 RepID=UPI003C771AA6
MNFRSLEKTTKFGYLFYISYRGTKFHSFDENKDENSTKKTVKGEFIKILGELGITWAKGVQQGGRTDGQVSARENMLYINSNNKIDKNSLKDKFNKKINEMKIIKIEKTLPNLALPEMIEGRTYRYNYPVGKISSTREEILKKCEKFTGTYDVSEFTDKKGEKLKEKVRSVEVSYNNESLVFSGNSFMPKQVRIMSGYILTGEKKILPGKYLTLEKMILSKELEEIIIEEVNDISEENVLNIEKIKDVYIFYVAKNKKGEVIGKNASNIKNLRKKYGKIIIKTI